MSDSVLILQEVELHPNSVLTRLTARFELPSILHITSRDELRSHNRPPLFDSHYLVIFDSVRVLESNLSYIKFDFMFPVLHCTSKSSRIDAVEMCKEKKFPYKVYVNSFSKEDAFSFIRGLASCQPSIDLCKAIVAKTGLNPQRIISAVMVCEQVGYTKANINKFIDKYIYVAVQDIVEVLLGACRSNAQYNRAFLYLHMNRIWFNQWTRSAILTEIDWLLKVYEDLISGDLTSYTISDYADENGYNRYRILYATELFEKVSLIELLELKNFISNASVLELALRLS